jgi:uncharacterized protein YbaR (Trm112 family)/protein-L-isoaspartate O-methyltransferase
MRPEFLELLVCPACRSGTHASPLVEKPSGLACEACGGRFPVIDGLPVLLPDAATATDRTAAAFAHQWQLQNEGSYEQETIYGETAEEELASFRSRFGIERPEELAGKTVLDIGCGSGRLTANLARWAPQAIVAGGERSEAARIAHRRCQGASGAFIVQTDLLRSAFRPRSFDFVYADGVVPHVPDPEAAVGALDDLVRPGGKLFVWIYPRTFSPYRLLRDVLVRPARFPLALQRAIEWTVGVPLWAAFKLYERGHGPRRRSLREVLFMLHDNLAPEYQHRRSPAEMARSFARTGYRDIAECGQETGIVGTKPEQ